MTHNQGLVRPNDPQLPAGVVRLEGRLMFCSLDAPRAVEEGQKKKYGCGFHVDPTHPQFAAMVAALKEAMKAVVEKKWSADPAKWPDDMRQPLKDPMRVIERGTGKPYDGMMSGGIFFNATTERPPGLVRADNSRITDAVSIKSELYSGAFAVITVNAYVYGGPPTRWRPGVSIGLRSIQKIGGGDPLGGVVVDPEKEFAPAAPPKAAGLSDKPITSVRDLFS